MNDQKQRGTCRVCGRRFDLTKAGKVRQHISATDRLMNCRGWGREPLGEGAPPVMPDTEPKVGPLENRAVMALLVFLGVAGIVLTALLLWQFRDVFTPIGILIGGAWVFQRNVLRRQS